MRLKLCVAVALLAGSLQHAEAQSAAIHFTKTDPREEALKRQLQSETDDKDARYIAIFRT